MTRPSDIPEWAWEKALVVFSDACSADEDVRWEAQLTVVTLYARAILSAVEEERERQAKSTEAMADALYEKADAEDVDGRDSAFAAWVTQNVAAAIRQRKET